MQIYANHRKNGKIGTILEENGATAPNISISPPPLHNKSAAAEATTLIFTSAMDGGDCLCGYSHGLFLNVLSDQMLSFVRLE